MKINFNLTSKKISESCFFKVVSKIGVLLMVQLFFGAKLIKAQQLEASIQQTGVTANSCTRTLTAQVQSGSGSYSYSWSISTPGIPFPGPNNVKTIEVALDETADFSVFVQDNATGYSGNEYATVPRILLGNFNTFIPNVFTPNGDGYNDLWLVSDSNKGYGAINAYYYRLIIRNINNTIVYQSGATVSSGHLGIMGGDISWNGRINGTGNPCPVGTYQYSLQLQNCSYNNIINGSIDIFR